jgi:hypothetical protein
MKYLCSEEENKCPHCGSTNIKWDMPIKTIRFDCSLYEVAHCKKCKKDFVNPYLLEYDVARPSDEMEVDLP